ncbi:MAG: YitT family protein [Bacilli bacterium]|nr:YitT family protein [Bacilli bacterium]
MNSKNSFHTKFQSWKYDHPVLMGFLEHGGLFLICTASALLFSFGFKTFMAPQFDYKGEAISNVVTGGASGVAQDIVLFFDDIRVALPGGDGLWHTLLYFIINIPLMVLCFLGIGKRFAIYTVLNIVEFTLFGIMFDSPAFQPVLQQIYSITPENGGLIARCMLGGVCTGFSSGVAFKFGFSTGGIDIISYFISAKKRTSVGKYSVVINVVIVSVFFILSLFKDGSDLTTACKTLFAVLYMIVSSLVIDMIHIRNKKCEIKIITKLPALSDVLLANVPHGATITKGVGAFSGEEKIIITTIVSSYEADAIVKIMQENDPHCFISVTALHQVYGRFFTPAVK